MKEVILIDNKIYHLAKDFLPTRKIAEVTSVLIERYLNPLSMNPKPTTKEEIYHRILKSAQNANMKAGVIGRAIGGVEKLAPILSDFNPKAVLKEYDKNCEAILDDIVKKLKPNGEIRRTTRSIWPNYCKTIKPANK